MRLLPLSTLLLSLGLSSTSLADTAGGGAGGGLYPPGLQPLISRANALLTVGQFADAAKLYTEAIDQSPSDYVLYYKRATAYFSLQRHQSALDDFDKVLELTKGTFDLAQTMRAKVGLREGNWDLVAKSLEGYKKGQAYKINKDGKAFKEVKELEDDLHLGERMESKMEKERRAGLWTACVESATQALRVASHSIEIRSVRAECELGSGDIEGAVGDLSRLSNLLPPSTTLHTTIFRLSYFFLQVPSSPSPVPLNTLKQCLHFDPDSKPCLSLRRLYKNFEKQFTQLEDLRAKEDWRGIIKLVAPSATAGKKGDLLGRFDEALKEHTARPSLLPPQLQSRSNTPDIPLPDPMLTSPLRLALVRSLCVAYTHLASPAPGSQEKASAGATMKKEMASWCIELLKMDADDVDGLVGKGEALVSKEEWEEGARVLEKAWENCGQSRRDVHQRVSRAQKLLKQSKRKDYYKILGVSRDADAKTIKKAFRQAAKTAHPDKGGSEAKMAAVNEAYELLSDPELRARFDNGEDPNDPMSQQGGPGGFYGSPFGPGGGGGGFPGGHPFAQFFQQGGHPGSGGGSYQFHFGH